MQLRPNPILLGRLRMLRPNRPTRTKLSPPPNAANSKSTVDNPRCSSFTAKTSAMIGSIAHHLFNFMVALTREVQIETSLS